MSTSRYDNSVALVAAAETEESDINLVVKNSTKGGDDYNEKSRILQPDEELMTREELPRKPAWFYYASYIILVLGLPVMITLTFAFVDDYETYFIQRVYNFVIGVTIFYLTGAVFKKYLGMRTAYTRKIIHITSFSLPLIIDAIDSQLQNATVDALWGAWQAEIWMGAFFTIPVREFANEVFGNPTKPQKSWSANALTYCNFCEMSFDALDRPEDRPNTLLWLQTQIILTYLFYIILAAVFQYDTATPLVLLIPVFIGGLGDGLAEPVGVNFGKTGCGTGIDCTFKTHGCCTKYDYTRSVPGSAMVLLSGYVGVAAAYSEFTTWQFIIAMLVLPPLGAIVEAKAPHTMDNPFIVLIIGAASIGILQIPF